MDDSSFFHRFVLLFRTAFRAELRSCRNRFAAAGAEGFRCLLGTALGAEFSSGSDLCTARATDSARCRCCRSGLLSGIHALSEHLSHRCAGTHTDAHAGHAVSVVGCIAHSFRRLVLGILIEISEYTHGCALVH